MTVSIPTPIDSHTTNSTRAGTWGGASNIGDKASGGLPLNNKGTQWYGKNVAGGAGLYWNFSSTQNFSTNEKIYIIAHQYNAPNRVSCATAANQGLTVRMYTDVSNYRTFIVGGQDTDFGKFRRSPTPVVIDPTTAGDIDTGAYNAASVASYGFGVRYTQFAGGTTNWNYVTRSVLMGTKKTDSDIPRLYGSGVKLKDLHAAVFGTTGWASTAHVYTESAGDTYTYLCPFAVGYSSQGSTATSFDDEGITIVSPAHKTVSDPRFHLSNTAMRVHLDLLSSDTATFSGTYIWGTEAPFNFNSSAGATVTLNNATFSGMGNFTVGSDVSGTATWSLGGTSKVISNSSAIEGTINGAMDLNSATNLSNLTITGDLHINTGANSTITFSNVTVSGSVYNDDTAHTLTINSTNGSSITAGDAGTGNGQTNILNTVTIKVTVLDESTGTGINLAHVILQKQSDKSTIVSGSTNSSGIYSTTLNYTTDIAFVGWARQWDLAGNDYTPKDISGTITSAGVDITVKLVPINL